MFLVHVRWRSELHLDLGKGPISGWTPSSLTLWTFPCSDWPELASKGVDSIQTLDAELCWDPNQVPNLLCHSHPDCVFVGRTSEPEKNQRWSLFATFELHTQIHTGSLIESDTHLHPASFKAFACCLVTTLHQQRLRV